MKIKDIMSKEIACVDAKSTAADAAKKMKDQNVGSVLVIEQNQLQGLVTDRAIATKAVAEEKDPRSLPVTDIMTKEIIGCSEDDDVFDVLQTMGKNQIRRLPVVNEQSQLVGVVSMADIAQQMRTGMDSMFDEISKSAK
ncbi:MAG TPA: CBS domain-containing protein [Methanocella sp.]